MPELLAGERLLPPIYVRNYDKEEYKAACQNWDVAVSPEGTLYVANSAGLLTFDGNNWNLYPLPDRSEVLHVITRNDTIYTQSESSVGYWLPDKFGHLNYSPLPYLPDDLSFQTMPASFPFALPDVVKAARPVSYIQMNRVHYFGTLMSGLYILDEQGEIIAHITDRYLLKDNMIHGMGEYRNKQFYIAYDNGFSIIDLSPAVWTVGKRGRIGKLKSAVLADRTLYIETNMGYYARTFDPKDRFVPVSESVAKDYLKKEICSLPFNIPEIIESNRKLDRFREYDDLYVVNDSSFWLVKGNEACLFSLEEGKMEMKCRFLPDNYRLNLVTRDPQIFPLTDSLHLFSTMQGIILVNTSQLLEQGKAKGVPHRVTRIEYSTPDSVYFLPPDVKCIVLPYDFHKVTIWVGSSVFTPNNQISYKLDKVQAEWSPWQKEGNISFLQLPEGKYTLRIRKYVPTGDFPEITIPLEVSPPWYNTLTAYTIYVLLIWFLIYATIRVHLSNQRRRMRRRVQQEMWEEKQRLECMKNELLEKELENKNNELALQTSSLVRKSRLIHDLIEELDKQKENLGDRYPVKMYKRLRSMLEGSFNDQSDWASFETYFTSAHQHFIERLQQVYKEITPGDIRLCCLLRMNLSTKEIASILNISIRAVELRRYRLRKRMNLESETNLTDYLMTF